MIRSTGYSKPVIKEILKLLSWSKGKSLFFHPLLEIDTDKGKGYLIVLLPPIAINVYRFLDYWIDQFKLTNDIRGHLFEEQVEEELIRATEDAGISDDIIVLGPRKYTSADKSSQEEIDLILLINDLLVVGEVKCQTLPTTDTDISNYLASLKEGASQAIRKVSWVKENLEIVAGHLNKELKKLSGIVTPIVISNHSVGVGLKYSAVPILDLLMLKNYLARPYQADLIQKPGGFKETQTSPRFYLNPREMADKFIEFANEPYFLHLYMEFLEPQWRKYPLRHDGPVNMMQYVVNDEKVQEYIQKSWKQ